VVQACEDITIHLDMRGMDLSTVKTEFRNCKHIRLESIILDRRLADAHTLDVEFQKVGIVTISGVQVDTSVQVMLFEFVGPISSKFSFLLSATNLLSLVFDI
jgi:hypothetical protein